VVLGDPDVVVAELLGVDDLVEDFVVELGPGLAPLGRIAEVEGVSEGGRTSAIGRRASRLDVAEVIGDVHLKC